MKIVTDCAADMPAKERDELGVIEAPLYIQFPEGEVNSADITPDDFYSRLEAMRPEIPTTALPSSGVFNKLYNKLAESNKQILSIHISSGLSGTFNSARMGAEQGKAGVVDIPGAGGCPGCQIWLGYGRHQRAPGRHPRAN